MFATPPDTQAAAGGEAVVLVPGAAGREAQEKVRLNPVGEWTLAIAWVALVAINLWTWRMILKKRAVPGAPPGAGRD